MNASHRPSGETAGRSASSTSTANATSVAECWSKSILTIRDVVPASSAIACDDPGMTVGEKRSAVAVKEEACFAASVPTAYLGFWSAVKAMRSVATEGSVIINDAASDVIRPLYLKAV